MEYTKKMVLVPQETLTKLQSATPTTLVIDGDMRKLFERQEGPDGRPENQTLPSNASAIHGAE